MRAVLIVNPKATATTPGGRDILARALASDLKLDVVETTHRGHAADIAAEAARDGLDLVVTLGGDGTVNEAVNGLMTGTTDGPRPAYAVVPGGSANVFSRGLGLPADPVEATSTLLEALRAGRRRQISLGSVNGRYFSFCAGIGYDAECTGIVEGRRRDGARSTPGLYVRTAVRHFYDGSDRADLTSDIAGESPIDGLQMVVVSNTSPWTYWGARPLRPSPEASFETGLDVFAMRKMRLVPTLRALSQMASPKAAGPRGRSVSRRHDLASFALTASRPAALEVDGDYVGEFERFELLSVPDALTVIA
jgi:diacylglycerol kinase family enzyme